MTLQTDNATTPATVGELIAYLQSLNAPNAPAFLYSTEDGERAPLTLRHFDDLTASSGCLDLNISDKGGAA